MTQAGSRDPRTRYEAIAEHVRGLIADRHPGDRLPSEAELCERFQVSRMTARHAIQILENEGLLYRKRGDGTFVRRPPVARTLGSPLSFSENMRARGLSPSSTVLARSRVKPTEAEMAALEIDATDRPYMIERLRLADGVPMAIERAVIAPDCKEVLDSDLVSGSLHDAFLSLGRIPSRALAHISARKGSPRERRLLALAAGGVVLAERRTIFDQHDRPLEHTETRYAAERYSFEAVLYRPDDPTEAGEID